MELSRRCYIAFRRCAQKFKGRETDPLWQSVVNSCYKMYENFQGKCRAYAYEYRKYVVRRYRWRDYIRSMKPPLYLVSLTFDDKALTYKPSTRRHYVTEALKFFDDYQACIDFGKKTNREHYHAIVSSQAKVTKEYYVKKYKKVNLDGFDWQWFSDIEPLNLDGVGFYKSFNYAFKAADYSFKNAKVDEDVRPFHKRKPKTKPYIPSQYRVDFDDGFIEISEDEELPF